MILLFWFNHTLEFVVLGLSISPLMTNLLNIRGKIAHIMIKMTDLSVIKVSVGTKLPRNPIIAIYASRIY